MIVAHAPLLSLFLTPLFSFSLLLLCFLKGVGELVSASAFFLFSFSVLGVMTRVPAFLAFFHEPLRGVPDLWGL